MRVQNHTLLQPRAGWQETIYFVVTSTIATRESPSGAICRRPSSDIKIEAAAVDNLPIAASPLVSSPQETKEDTKNTTGELNSQPLRNGRVHACLEDNCQIAKFNDHAMSCTFI